MYLLTGQQLGYNDWRHEPREIRLEFLADNNCSQRRQQQQQQCPDIDNLKVNIFVKKNNITETLKPVLVLFSTNGIFVKIDKQVDNCDRPLSIWVYESDDNNGVEDNNNNNNDDDDDNLTELTTTQTDNELAVVVNETEQPITTTTTKSISDGVVSDSSQQYDRSERYANPIGLSYNQQNQVYRKFLGNKLHIKLLTIDKLNIANTRSRIRF
ncbi:TPR repeat-containing protein DDB_G0287999-like [Oppia nitens]|uniref:TPR repeat-containing protein DDB_G0287999-like n=1 Tax=Oppia nitens TaxID=1686743 RepID=UPI0023D98C57|nr:TPR repeat-containing protein DDB_G0287999-like [Oppia nitens]